MKKRRILKKGLEIVLTAAMVAGLLPGIGTLQVSAATEAEGYENGFCTTYSEGSCSHTNHTDCNGYQPATLTTGEYDIDGDGDKDNDDVAYAISNAGQLYWFADKVNGGDTGINAVLTADITVNTGVLDATGKLASNISSFTSWTPIGNLINDTHVQYTGTFDGKGHTISGLYFAGSTSRLGFFGYVGSGGSVSNVGIVDSYFSGGQFAGGVCGDNKGSITNCYHTGAVSGEDAGGVCGYNSGSITNCYHAGAVSGTYVGGVCGYNSSSGSITNCYYETMDGIIGGIEGADVTGQAEGKDTEKFKSGEVVYLLSHGSTDGSVWGQTLTGESRQDYPVLGGTTVYRNCVDGTVSYAHEDNEDKHKYENGVCIGCDEYEVPECVDTYYQIANMGNLYWFADKVNNDYENYGSANAVLTADITVNSGLEENKGLLESLTYDGSGNVSNGNSFTSWTPIGSVYAKRYTGTFDGKGHTIGGLYFNNEATKYVGFFGDVESGGRVSNVGIVDSYFYGKQYVGGVCGYSKGDITNCYNTGTVRGASGGYYVGGVCGYKDYPAKASSITNCYNTGVVSGSNNVGGVCGHLYGSLCSITNCYNTGEVSGSSSVGGVCGKKESGSITNCYYETMEGISGGIEGADVTGQAEGKDTEKFKSGEVAYLLSHGSTDGSIWGQTLTGEDKQDYPVLGGTTVYRKCINGSISYANNEEGNAHSYEEGICTVCGEYEEPACVDTYYQIGNMGNLYWFAGLVNGDDSICTGGVTQDTSANAVLKADIIVNKGVLDKNGKLAEDTSSFKSWTPIGNLINSTHVQYTGTFDGKGHTISGLYFAGATSRLGFFGYVGKGGSVSNVGIVDSYFSGGTYAGGVCGDNSGSITNCYHTGSVSDSSYAGGVCGNNSGSITNCYHTGSVSDSSYAGGVCGDNSGSITNCYYETMDGITGGIKGADVAGQAEGKTTRQFNSGEVAYLLSHGSTDGSIWGQTLTEESRQDHPVLGGTPVYRNPTDGGNSYINEEQHSHTYVNGICIGCDEYEVPACVDTYYQIANMGNLYWFADKVNNDYENYGSANAVLTADITVNSGLEEKKGLLESLTYDGSGNVSNGNSFTSWTPIGSVYAKRYTGTFDGKGHTIGGLYFNDSGATGVGLFARLGSKGCVSNVGIVDSYFCGQHMVGGVCGYNIGGTITNCYHSGTVHGKGNNNGGVCGANDGTITNCYHTGTVSGVSNVGSVCGSNIGSVTNCYYDSTKCSRGGIGGSDQTGQAEGKTTLQFAGGEVAYLLSQGCTVGDTTYGGDIWGQTLNTDAYPVLGGAKVYMSTGCVMYSNEDIGFKEHNYNGNDICENCGRHKCVITNSGYSTEYSYTGNPITAPATANFSVNSGATLTFAWYAGDQTGTADLSGVTKLDTEPANAGTYTLVVTAPAYTNGEADYTDAELRVKVEIEKVDATVSQAPKAAAGLTYNKGEAIMLIDATDANVTGGEIWYALGEDGTYSKALPTATDAGEYQVYYKVVGDDNHNDTTPVKIDVTVDKATPSYTVPTDLTAKCGDLLSSVTLTDGLEWTDDTSAKLEAGEEESGQTVSKTAKFVPTDKKNYKEVTGITINIKVEHTLSATQVPGNAGAEKHASHCSACSKDFNEVACSGGTATCTNKAVCSVCKGEYGALDPDNHKFTTYVKDNDETCTTDGHETATCDYGCGKTDSKEIAGSALGHDYEASYAWATDGSSCTLTLTCKRQGCTAEMDGHVDTHDCTIKSAVKTAATCKEKGTTTYTATYGNYSDTKDIQDIAINPENHTGETEVKNKKDATCKETGYTGDTICKACGGTLKAGTVIDKLTTHSYVNGVCSVCDDIFKTTVNGVTYQVMTETGADGKPVGKLVTVSGNEIPQVAVAVTGTGDDFTEKNPDGKVTVPSEITGSGSEQTFVVTKISDNAFSGASVTEIVVPATVTEVETGAFGGATTITFNGATAPSGIAGAISDTVTTVNVPEGAADSYREALGDNVEVVEIHTHTFDTKWTYDDTYHWHASTCGHEQEVADKAEHTFGEWTVTKEATEDAEGVKERSCSCGYKETAKTDKLAHTTHVKDNGTRVEPTCEKKGSITYKCTKCNKVMEVVELDATGHKWDAGKVTKEATETAEGVKTYTCSVCGKTKTEAIPKKTATTQEPPKKGDVVKDDKASAKVEVTDVKKKEVAYEEPANKKAKTVTIPATVKINGVTYKVTKISDNAFKGNKTVTKVTIGSNIKTVGKNAFSGATKLKTVKVGKNVTEVGSNAFKGCSSLTSVTLPSKTTKIGANAFNGCKKLKTIKLTSTKLTSKTVAKNAFKGLTKATTIKVPKKKLSAYKKLFKQKGLSSKVKVKGY